MAPIPVDQEWLHKDLRLIAKILAVIALGESPAESIDRGELLQETLAEFHRVL